MLTDEVVKVGSPYRASCEKHLTAMGATLTAEILGWLVPFHLHPLKGRN